MHLSIVQMIIRHKVVELVYEKQLRINTTSRFKIVFYITSALVQHSRLALKILRTQSTTLVTTISISSAVYKWRRFIRRLVQTSKISRSQMFERKQSLIGFSSSAL